MAIGCGDAAVAVVGPGGSAKWAFDVTRPVGGEFARLELVFATCETGGNTVLTVDGVDHDDVGGCGENSKQRSDDTDFDACGGCGARRRNERVAMVLGSLTRRTDSSVAILIQVRFYHSVQSGTLRLGVTCNAFSSTAASTSTAPTVVGATATDMKATHRWARESPATLRHHRHDCFALGPFPRMAAICGDCDWATSGDDGPIASDYVASDVNVNNDANTPHFQSTTTTRHLDQRTAFVCGYTGPWGGSWRMPAELRAEISALGVACETIATIKGLKQQLKLNAAAGNRKEWLFRLKQLGKSLNVLGFQWRNERALRTLPPRNASCPWVVDFDGGSSQLYCNYNGSAALCAPWMENDLFLRKDVLFLSVDRAGHKLRRAHNTDTSWETTAAAMLPGITRWPPCKRCRPRAPPDWPQEWSSPRRFLISYQGNCQGGWFNSSRARPLLRHLFEKVGALADPRTHFKCSGQGNCRSHGAALTDPCRLEQSTEFDRDFYLASLNATFALVPHGDGPWSFRFSEVVAAGVIPVIIADGLDLPMSQLVRWEDAAIRISEGALERMTSVTELLDLLPTGARRQQMLRTVAALGSHFFGGKDPVEAQRQGLNEAIRRAVAANVAPRSASDSNRPLRPR